MAVFVSDELKLGLELEQLGVFDSLMDEDSNFFINIKRLKDTEDPEFKDSYDNINAYFRDLGILKNYRKNYRACEASEKVTLFIKATLIGNDKTLSCVNKSLRMDFGASNFGNLNIFLKYVVFRRLPCHLT